MFNSSKKAYRFPVLRKILVTALAQTCWLAAPAQYYEEPPGPEIGIGIKVIKGQVIYGPKSFYTTDNNSIGLQALFRYDRPFVISSLSPYQKMYIDFVVESGFLFFKANVFDSVFIDPATNAITRDKSAKNPTYFPVYIGLSTRNRLSVGTSLFYWKGLGPRDTWGTKFLSLSYNAQNFRVSAAGEWYAQTKNTRHSGFLFSVDFWWKLVIKD